MEPSESVLGVVLAGGESRRFGARKALVEIGGERIIDRCLGALDRVCRDVVVVANELDPYRDTGRRIRPDVRPGSGVLGGIHTAVAWAEELRLDGALVLACDMPFVPVPLLAALVERGSRSGIAVADSGGPRGMEPLCAVYGVACREWIERRLDEGARAIVSFFPDVAIDRLDRASVESFGRPEEMFFNMNRPHDLRLAEELARSTGESSGS